MTYSLLSLILVVGIFIGVKMERNRAERQRRHPENFLVKE